jgi:hypothetical protein
VHDCTRVCSRRGRKANPSAKLDVYAYNQRKHIHITAHELVISTRTSPSKMGAKKLSIVVLRLTYPPSILGCSPLKL